MEPLQPPEAAHAVALVDAQVSVDVAPIEMVRGFEANVSVGIGAGCTMIVVVADIDPPDPVQLRT